MVQRIEQDKLIVTQANKLAEASYTMTLEEKRIVMLMMALVRKDDGDFHTYRIPVTEVRDFLGLENDKDLYGRLKKVTMTLRSRTFLIEKAKGGFLAIGWVSSAEYKPKGEDGIDVACLELCFDPKLKPYLLALIDQFSNYMLQNAAGLRSFYSIRIYELLNARRKLKKAVFDVDELKKILKLEGRYANYKDFRNAVLLVAQRELSEKTDLAFDFEDNAVRGRKVTSITFHIRDNVPSKLPRSAVSRPILPKPSKIPDNDADERQAQLLPPTKAEQEIARLYREAIAAGIENGVRENAMRELLETRDPRHVMENIELARKRHINSKKEGADLAALTVAAITSDYAADSRGQQAQAATKVTARARAKAARELLEKIETAAVAARRHELQAQLDALPDADRSALRAAFAAKIEEGEHGDHFAVTFRLRGWEATGAEAYFRIFASEQLGIGSELDFQRAEAARRGHELEKLKSDAGK